MRRMRSWSKMMGLPLMLSALCAGGGCGQDMTSTATVVEVASYPLIPNMALAQGFNPSTESPALHQCFAHDPPIETDLYNFSSRAFAVYNRDEMVAKFARLNQMMIDPELLSSQLNELYAQVASLRVLVLPIFVQTIERSVEPAEGGGAYCDPQNFQTPGEGSIQKQFTNECGLQYLKSERYGGYIFLAIDTSQLTQIQWRRVLQITEAGALTDAQDAKKTLSELEKVFGTDALFTIMRTDYIPAPDPNFMRDGKLVLSKWSDYAAQIIQNSQDPNAGSNRHGLVVRQVFDVYSEVLVEGCTKDREFSSSFSCYNNFNTVLMDFQHGETIKNMRSQINWVGDFNNLDRIEWPEGIDSKQAQDSYAQMGRDIDSCDLNKIDVLRQVCDKVFFSDTSKSCAHCVVDPICDPNALMNRFFLLPPYKVKDPNELISKSTLKTYISSKGSGGAIGNADKMLCLLGGVQGDFAGGAESVQMKLNTNSEWLLEARGVQSVYGIGHCVDRNDFIGENGDQTWLVEEHHHVDATGDSQLFNGTWITALQGLQGKMRGGGEAVWTIQADPNRISTLHSQSFQNDMLRGYSTSFGLANFKDYGNRWSKDVSGRVESALADVSLQIPTGNKVGQKERLLAHSEDAICYLTKVQGDFSGDLHSARLTVNGEGFWMLSVTGNCQTVSKQVAYGELPCSKEVFRSDVRAVARCLKYDQSL